MKTSIFDDFIATIFGGMLAGLFLPLLLIVFVLFQYGIALDMEDTGSGMVYFGLLGFVGGLIAAISIGFPMLLLLKRLNLDYPIVLVAVGACVATFLFYWLMHWPFASWHKTLLAVSLGALCGAATSYFRKLSALTRRSRGAPAGKPAAAP